MIKAPIGSSFGLKGPSLKVPILNDIHRIKRIFFPGTLQITVVQNFSWLIILKVPGAFMHSHFSMPAEHAASKSAYTASMKTLGSKSAGSSCAPGKF